MDAGGGDKAKKTHKKAVKGRAAVKKKEKKEGKVERHNPKAHTFSGGVKSVEKRVRRTLEQQSKKEHAPKVDKTPDIPAPFVVVVHGPPGVGKTTLIQSLVKHYARQHLNKLQGPVTLVSGRHRRLTIMECPQDMGAMLDLAKIADLVLLMIDASFGFELETFEFINVLQVHGFPKVIGVLTHLDSFNDNKQLRKVKKTMKSRFWSELFDGAKLFHLSGLQYGRYHRLEVQNLARFIAVTKGTVLSWRQSHPYMLALRWEDQTDPAEPPSAPRTLDLYGYVCGGRLREGTHAHLAGAGDFQIAALKSLTDPCPPPTEVEKANENEKAKAAAIGDKPAKPKKKNVLRTLAERHRIIYAPGSDVGSITVDSDAMYIQLPDHQAGFTVREGEAEGRQLPEAVRLVRELQAKDLALGASASGRPGLRLLGDATVRPPEAAPASRRERRRAPAGDADVAVVDGPAAGGAEDGARDGEEDGQSDAAEEDEEDEEEEEGDEAQGGGSSGGEDARRQGFLERARQRFERAPRLEEAIYGGGTASTSAGSRGRGRAPETSEVGAATVTTDHAHLSLFDDDGDEEDEAGAAGQQHHRAGRGSAGPGAALLGNLGDPDGLDTSRMPVLPREAEDWGEERREELKTRKFITGGWSSAEEDEDGEPKPAADGAQGGEAGEQGEEGVAPDKAVAAVDGFSDGVAISAFVRIRLEGVPAAYVAEMRRDRPVLLGGLLPGEQRMGMTQVRVKRHRWHPKLLKSGDALLMSVGWRRYQSVPTFSLEDRGEKRMRYLKYSLEHAHCVMTMYGPMVPPNAGVMAFRSWNKVSHFRVCATGGVLESAPNFDIRKKLKLVGEPYKIFRNTAFVKGMFNSDLEVSKYSHSKIQTVSGIRGEIKKAEGTRGCFRATFEDRILMSDLVVCKCWVRVEPRQFFHPVVDAPEWRPARLIGELRASAGVPVPDQSDSHYGKQLVRPARKFNPLKIPKQLQAALPFKSKPKQETKRRKNPLRQKAAIVPTEREHAINSLLTRLHTVQKEKRRVRLAASAKKKVIKEKRSQFIQDKREAYTAENKKKRYIKEGNQESQKRKSMMLD